MPHLNDPGTDLTVDVFVVHEDRVLLRVHDKFGVWLTPGGHIERHESPNEAALREVLEEVGLRVELVPPADDRWHWWTTDELRAPNNEVPRVVREHALAALSELRAANCGSAPC